MDRSRPDIIPFSEAALCLDCNNITRASHERCRACGSSSVLFLAAVLGEVEGRGHGGER